MKKTAKKAAKRKARKGGVSTQSTLKRKKAFLEEFAKCATITHAARATNIGRQSHYDWLKKDKKYQVAFAEAEVAASDALLQEARRRAIQGVEEPILYKGKVVRTIQKYSDSLLMFLMKGDQPEKYRDNHHITGGLDVNLVQLMNEGRDRLAQHRKG